MRWPRRQPRDTATAGPRRWLRLIGRLVHRGLVVVMWTLMGLALVIGAVLVSGTVRSRLLGAGLGTIEERIPGAVSFSRAGWPRLGLFEFTDLVWTDGGLVAPDTLAVIPRLAVRLDMMALRHRDVRVDALTARIDRLDVPAVQAFLAAQAAAGGPVAAADSTAGPGAFPRPGCLPGVPSLAIDRLDLAVARAVLAPDVRVSRVVLAGQLEAGYGRAGRLVVDHLAGDLMTTLSDSVGARPWAVSVGHLGLGVSVTTDTTAAGEPVIVAATVDSCRVRLDTIGPVPQRFVPGARRDLGFSGPVVLHAGGRAARLGTGYDFALVGGFRLPAAADLADLLPARFPAAALGRTDGRLQVTGTWDRPALAARLDLDLSRTEGLEAGRVVVRTEADLTALAAGDYSAAAVVVDTCDIALLGTALTAGGRIRDGVADLRLRLAVRDSRLPRLVVPELAARGSATFVLDLTARGPISGPDRLPNLAGSLVGDFDLPTVPQLAPYLPAPLTVGQVGAVAGHLQAEGSVDYPRLRAALDLDLSPSAHLAVGRLVANTELDLAAVRAGDLATALLVVDTLAVSAPGAAVAGRGSYRESAADLRLEAAVTDNRLAALFAPDLARDAQMELNLDLAVTGALDDPTGALAVKGSLTSPRLTVPDLTLRVAGGLRHLEVDLRLPRGFTAANVGLDSLQTRLTGDRAAGDSLVVGFEIGARRGSRWLAGGGWATADSLGRAPTRTLHLDSLAVGAVGRRMRLTAPATIRLGPGAGDIVLQSCELSGEPGSIGLAGRADPAGLDLLGTVALRLPEDLLVELAPNRLWTDEGGRDATVDAHLRLQGTRSVPKLDGAAAVRLIPHRNEPNFGADLTFNLTDGDSAAVTADMAFVSADTTALAARLRVPGAIDPAGGRWRATPGQNARLDVPDQILSLARINRLLPPDVSLHGNLTVGARVEIDQASAGPDAGGAPGRLAGSVTGRIASPRLEMRLPNRSRLEVVPDVALSGSLQDPRVAGRIEIKSGFIRIPEIPRTLLPIEGDPLLWRLATPDSQQVSEGAEPVFRRPPVVGPVPAAAVPYPLPDLALDVHLPGNFRVHGYGLDAELAGDLKVSRGVDDDDVPRLLITGETRVLQGTLQFMNRVFTVSRGEALFEGRVPPDPALDILMETTVSGATISIQIGGTARVPTVSLSSDPAYEEQDIVALLLFGSPLGELEGGQSGTEEGSDAARQLRQNLAGLAMVFGTSGLQNTVSQTIGVDMVEVGSGTAGDSTLMVGKFIGPKLMLKYHQSLEMSGTYFLTIEYALSRIFKLVTTYGQGEENSGLELKWNRRW